MNDNRKMKSISGKKLFLIIYMCIFGSIVLFSLFSELSSGGEDLSVFWMIIIIHALEVFIFMLPFLLIVKFIKKSDKVVKKESMSKIDFSNTKEYYRDVINKYSIAELSYIDDFNIDYPKDIIATLLSLVLKKKVTIDNNYITILDFETVNLKESEIYVLENIKDGKVKLKNSHDILKYAQLEAIDDKLIKESTFNVKKAIIKSIIGNILKILIFWLVLNCFCSNVEEIITILERWNFSEQFIFVIFLLFGFGSFIGAIFIFLSVVKSIFYIILKSISYERTDIGEDVNKKIEGLKNYINDFSILDEREQQELMLWEDYLIYSVLFDQNDKVINELSSLVEAEMEVGKVYFGYGDNDNVNK